MTTPRRLVLDAGPLIALLHRNDHDHDHALAGFRELTDGNASLVTPLPILFEVYKWLLYEAGPGAAQQGLHQMRRSLDITYPIQEEFAAAATLTGARRNWTGTLEDAIVAVTALRSRIPVWTLNYRDLRVFPELQFWNPR